MTHPPQRVSAPGTPPLRGGSVPFRASSSLCRVPLVFLAAACTLLGACAPSRPVFSFQNDSSADLALRVYEGASETPTLDAPLVGPGGAVSAQLRAAADPAYEGPRVRVRVAPIGPRGAGDAYELALFKPPFRVRASGVAGDLRFTIGAPAEAPAATDITDRPPPRVPGDAVR